MTDDIIGSIQGTATFEAVEVLKQESGDIRVVGVYNDDTTTYETAPHRVRIGGMVLDYLEHSMAFTPAEGKDFVWVEATEDELRISMEKPEQ